ncbi:MAG: transposase [Cyanobacteria bacterium P01_C01_bin.121]
MKLPQLYRQLENQLRQYVLPKDRRHLQGYAEAVAAILQSGSACLSHWLPFLDHRGCGARAHMERLSYLVHNEHINAARYYQPLLAQFIAAFKDEALVLTLDTSILWDTFCLIEVCLAWGGRSITLAQTVIRHGSATVGFETYRYVLESAQTVLPTNAQVTLLADRGFEHGELIRWLNQQQWDWVIRAKSDLIVYLASGRQRPVRALLPPSEEVYLFNSVTILDDIDCHLATANLSAAGEPWAVVSKQPASLQTFALYGQRFGGIEPHFKDYKSAAFDILRSHLRDATALTCLVMLLDTAALIASVLGFFTMHLGQHTHLDWHQHRGLSFLQLGLRELSRLGYQHLPLPRLSPLPNCNPPPACASIRKQQDWDFRIEFSRITRFSG